jgi:hypothetical protein
MSIDIWNFFGGRGVQLEIFKVNSSSSTLLLHTYFSLTTFHVMEKEIGMPVLEWDMALCTQCSPLQTLSSTSQPIVIPKLSVVINFFSLDTHR